MYVCMYILIRYLRSMISNPSVFIVYLRIQNLILVDIGLELRAKPKKILLFLQITSYMGFDGIYAAS